MIIDNINLIYFSPTGTTRKIVHGIAEAFKIKSILEYDITRPDTAGCKIYDNMNSLTIIGVPVYGGRVPADAVERINKFQSYNTAAVTVVVYGNRAFDDSLLELSDISAECGFNIIAAGAFIAEHTYSSDSKPIAKGRPDAEDMKKTAEFVHLIKGKIQNSLSASVLTEPDIPGNKPFKERKPSPPSSPDTIEEKCTSCGQCVDLCPVSAITLNGKLTTDKETCIHCCACVKLCPENARVFDDPRTKKIVEMIFPITRDRKKPEFFL